MGKIGNSKNLGHKFCYLYPLFFGVYAINACCCWNEAFSKLSIDFQMKTLNGVPKVTGDGCNYNAVDGCITSSVLGKISRSGVH